MISAQEVTRVLTMPACIEAMERAFAEEAQGTAASHPRQRYRVPRETALGERGYMANMIAGAVPSLQVAALRYDSAIVQEREVYGARRLDWLYPSRRSWGFVLLFSTETGEPLAIIQDFALSPLRVGATTGVAVRAMARKDARRLGVFGSGNEAQRNLEAVCLVRPIEQVVVYSPTRQHREVFAEEMAERLGVPITPVDDPRDVVRGADIVLSATSASEPVVHGAWLEPGQFVITIANTDGVHARSEADAETMIRSDLIVLNSKETAIANQQRELLDLVDGGRVSWSKVTELGAVLVGAQPGRLRDEQLIYYKSNAGVGIQFAAAGALIYRACKQQGLGHEVPAEWFGADVGEWLDRGYLPSP
jgi:alanine dehydrogenase